MSTENSNHILKERFEKLPSAVRNTLVEFGRRYTGAGWEIFLVGGSCRDLILGEIPKDFDFATNCPLNETKKLFKKVISTGETHGTLTVIFRGVQFEVTRYRKDLETDGRRAVISFSETIEEDLKRRDLRVNAIAYDVVSGNVVDSEGGLDDFNQKVIRFVGDPAERIQEDHLRAIRYIRFISKLSYYGFTFDSNEMNAVLKNYDDQFLAIERIYDELKKMFCIKNCDDRFLIHHLGKLKLFQRFFPMEKERQKVIRGLFETQSLLIPAFFYGNKKKVKQVIMELKLTRSIKRLLPVLQRFYGTDMSNRIAVKRFLNLVHVEDWKQHEKAVDWILSGPVLKIGRDILKKGEPVWIKDLDISGKDLKEMGITGRKTGYTLGRLQEEIWKKPEWNSHLNLFQMAKDMVTSPDGPVHPQEIPDKGGPSK